MENRSKNKNKKKIDILCTKTVIDIELLDDP